MHVQTAKVLAISKERYADSYKKRAETKPPSKDLHVVLAEYQNGTWTYTAQRPKVVDVIEKPLR